MTSKTKDDWSFGDFNATVSIVHHTLVRVNLAVILKDQLSLLKTGSNIKFYLSRRGLECPSSQLGKVDAVLGRVPNRRKLG